MIDDGIVCQWCGSTDDNGRIFDTLWSLLWGALLVLRQIIREIIGHNRKVSLEDYYVMLHAGMDDPGIRGGEYPTNDVSSNAGLGASRDFILDFVSSGSNMKRYLTFPAAG